MMFNVQVELLTFDFASVDFVLMSIGQVFYIKTNTKKIKEKLSLDKMNGHLY